MAINKYVLTDYHEFRKPEFGAKEYHDYITANIDEFDARIVKKGTTADRPTAGTENRWYLATDEPAIYYDDGSAWQLVAGRDASGETMSADEFLATADGSTTDPAFAFDGDQDTGLYRVSDGVIGVTTGGTKAAEFGAAGDVTLPNGGLEVGDGDLTLTGGLPNISGVDSLQFGSSTAEIELPAHSGATLRIASRDTGSTLATFYANDTLPRFFLGVDIRGDIVDDTATIYNSANSWVPLSVLEATDITLDGGTGLKNGSTATLGGSFSLDIEPADFTGAFLSDDGADALQANLGNGVEGDGSDNIRVAAATVAGAFLSAGANPYQLAVNLGGFLSGDGSDNVAVSLGSMLTGDGSDNITLALGTGMKDASGSLAVEPADFAGTLLSDDGSDTLQVDEGSISHDGIDQTTVDSSDHHVKTGASTGLNTDGDDLAVDTVATGTATLSSGAATISTGVTTTGTHLDVYLDPSGGGTNSADVKASARAFWDDNAGEYKVEILEDGTSVGNPDIGYRVVGA